MLIPNFFRDHLNRHNVLEHDASLRLVHDHGSFECFSRMYTLVIFQPQESESSMDLGYYLCFLYLPVLRPYFYCNPLMDSKEANVRH